MKNKWSELHFVSRKRLSNLHVLICVLCVDFFYGFFRKLIWRQQKKMITFLLAFKIIKLQLGGYKQGNSVSCKEEEGRG